MTFPVALSEDLVKKWIKEFHKLQLKECSGCDYKYYIANQAALWAVNQTEKQIGKALWEMGPDGAARFIPYAQEMFRS
jgi:hypothetical protein